MLRRAFVLFALATLFVTTHGSSSTPPSPYRARYMPGAEIYVPSWFSPVNATYDVVLFFHGLPKAMDDAFDRARINAILVSVNLGEGSGVFEQAFRNPRALDSLLASTQRELDKSGRAPGAKLGRIALVAWSAGFGAIGAILAQPANTARIDAVLLADALHTSYVGRLVNHEARTPEGRAAFIADETVLRKYADVADRAMRGERLFVFTHSSVRAPGYASTTDCARALLKMTGVAKVPSPAGPTLHGTRAIYEANRGDFHIKGFEGGDVEQHRDHLRYIDETMLPYLKARWMR